MKAKHIKNIYLNDKKNLMQIKLANYAIENLQD